jgi:hypothetical protein
MTPPPVKVQIAPEAAPSIPSWFGEVTIVAHVLTDVGLLNTIQERVRFARARFGIYETIDFVVVLIGYIVSGEPTIKDFYERLFPLASSFMALFGRENLPHRSTLSRFLASLDEPCVEALRALFQEDLVTRSPQTFPPGGLWDRLGRCWLVIDVDGTKQAARQRALPNTPELPAPHRRFDEVCARGYLGRKRGEVARTRTCVLQAHSHHWLGTFGGPGNGDYRGELARAVSAIVSYAGWLCMPLSHILIRLDGLYGNAVVIKELLESGVGVIVRGKDYAMLDLPAVVARLKLPPDQTTTHPESGASRCLFDCPDLLLTPEGPRVRLIVATHPATSNKKPPIGVLREKTVYELFITTMPVSAFTPADVLDLYLHRGSFETVLWDEDREQDSDRWCSHTACGQEFSQILQQWIWNIRLSFGEHLSPSPMRLTEFAPANTVESVQASYPSGTDAVPATNEPANTLESVQVSYPSGTDGAPATNEPANTVEPVQASQTSGTDGTPATNEPTNTVEPVQASQTSGAVETVQTQGAAQVSTPVVYGPPQFARRSWTKGFAGSDFSVQPNGTLRCPAGHPLSVQERRPERNGSLRVLYSARLSHCRPCPLKEQCQEAVTTIKPRRVSAVLWPISSDCSVSTQPSSQPTDAPPALLEPPPPQPPPQLAPFPVLWGDWPRSHIRRRWIHLLRSQTVDLAFKDTLQEEVQTQQDEVQTRAERAHWALALGSTKSSQRTLSHRPCH